MKIKIVQTIIAIAICALISYGLHSFYEGENKLLLTIGSFLFLSSTLIMTIGIELKYTRAGINMKVVSGIFFAIALISNLIFSFIHFSIPSYLIMNGLLFLLSFLLLYSLSRTKQ